jgi:6-phosphogluconolactonase/glucosamine-6-phosphate isomerase/deaminase
MIFYIENTVPIEKLLKKFFISKIKINKNKWNMMVTGGSSINKFYKSLEKIKINKNMNIFQTDERISSDKYLISRKISKNNFFKKKNLILVNLKIDDFIEKYNKILPKKMDIIFLSLGTNGHLASIFSFDNKNLKSKKKFIICNADTFPKKRCSVTLNYINKAKNIIVLIKGIKKGKILKDIILNKNKSKRPIQLLKKSTFFIDKKALRTFLI